MPTKLTPQEQERLDVVNLLLKGEMTNDQAATQLKLSIRQIKRLKKKVREEGVSAVVHQLKGKTGNHHLPREIKNKALTALKQKYSDFKPKYATEKLIEFEGVSIHPQTLRRWMSEEGLWKIKGQKKIDYHAWRVRKEYFGQLQQFDGSYHLWFEERLLDEQGNPVEVCLLAAIDDATGKITHAIFDFNEGVVPVFTFWKEYVEQLGKPLSIYLDKYSTYKINHKNAVDNSELMTQFEVVMKLLNITVIIANSPQAKGRIERLFQTLQDRLVKELRLNQINTIAEANSFLKENFISKFNDQFSVLSTKTGDVHRKLTQIEKKKLDSIFSLKETRRLNNDYTLQFKNHFYQLAEVQPVTIRPKEKILIEKWLDQTLHLSFRENYLNYFLLPEKPKKFKTAPAILTTHKPNWKPPSNHPWRQLNKQLFTKLKG
jgi:transposase